MTASSSSLNFTLPYLDLQRMFQLFVPPLYERDANPQPHYTHIDLARRILSQKSPLIANKLKSPYSKLIDSCFFSREGGGIALYGEYEEETPEVGLEQFAYFCLAESRLNTSTTPATVDIRPHFTFAAQFDFSGSSPLLIPQDVHMLVPYDNGESYFQMQPHDPASLRQAFCYANTAFLQILAEKPVRPDYSLHGIKDFEAPSCLALRHRTYDQLEADVRAAKAALFRKSMTYNHQQFLF
jgi:hypothetical protein